MSGLLRLRYQKQFRPKRRYYLWKLLASIMLVLYVGTALGQSDKQMVTLPVGKVTGKQLLDAIHSQYPSIHPAYDETTDKRLQEVFLNSSKKLTLAAVIKLLNKTLGISGSMEGGYIMLRYQPAPKPGRDTTVSQRRQAGKVQKLTQDSLAPKQPVYRSLREVTVYSAKKEDNEAALLNQRKRSATIQDGISAELMEKTGSITTVQALQRVTGVSVTDEKYIAVRGLGERSVVGLVNGTRIASSDPDRTTLPLDLIPASLLDNIVVYKTVTPDMPADAASGIVDLKTKSIPNKLVLVINVETGFNSSVGIGGKVNSFQNSDMGFWGSRINKKDLPQNFLNLSKEYPNGLGSIQQMIANAQYSPPAWAEVDRINGIMKHFDPVMTTHYKNAPVNQLYSVSFGNKYTMFRKHTLGVILGANYYRRTTDISGGELTQWSIYQGVLTGNNQIYSPRIVPNYITPNRLFMGKYQTYTENTGTEVLNYGVLGGLTYRFNALHQFGIQYVGSWGGENKATNLYGGYEYTGLPGKVNSDIYSIRQSYRTLNLFSVQGEDQFGKGQYAAKLSYSGSSSISSQNDPDYRYVSLATYMPDNRIPVTIPIDQYPFPGVVPTTYYTDKLYALTSGYVNGYGVYGKIQADPNGRRWRYLKETNYNYKADLSLPFRFFGKWQEFKTGFNYLYRKRSFFENQLFIPGSNYSTNGNIPLYLVNGNLDRLVGPEMIGIRGVAPDQREGSAPLGGFLYNSQKSPDNYTGFYETEAIYGMLDLRPWKKWRLTGGVRFEHTDIRSRVDTSNIFLDPQLRVISADGSSVPKVYTEPNSVYTTRYVPYWSANLVYSYNDKSNLRLAFNTTLARPELREITNVFEFDVFQLGVVTGNPHLINQNSKNLDFRWEYFPDQGEVIAFSAFGKQIKNQLVRIFDLKTEGLTATSPEYPTIQYQNDYNTGYIWGLEMEARKELGSLWAPLKHFFLGGNLMLAQSQVRKSDERYLANQSLDRNTPRNSPLFEQPPYSMNLYLDFVQKRWGTNLTASFNVVGERLVQINLTGEPDLYSRPAPMLDLVCSQHITKRLFFKSFVKNALDPAIETVYSNYLTGGTWYGKKYINRSYRRGREIMFGFTYNLF